MTNIIKNIPKKNMQTHIDKAFELINEFLPERYTSEVIEVLEQKGVIVSSGVVRNVRSRINLRIDVLNALLQVSKKYKKQFETLQENIK